LDNAEAAGDVEPLLGQLTGGHIVITTRRDAGWDRIADRSGWMSWTPARPPT
jgi:hypothetical protein